MDNPREIIAREPMHRSQVLAIAVATALNALDGFDVLSVSFASPGISKAWGISRAALGLVLSMELIGMGVGALALGALADRRGRRPTILGCLVVMAAGMLLASTARNVAALSLHRLFTGLGIGGMLAATNAVVAEYANARRRNLAVAIMAGGYPMGAVVGGSIATLLLASTGRWQSVFLFGGLVTIAFIPLVLLFVPETVAFLMHRRPDRALERINRTLLRQGRPPIGVLPLQEGVPAGFDIGRLFTPAMAGVTGLLTLAYFGHMMSFYFLVKWIPKIVTDRGFAPAVAGGVLVWANAGGVLGATAMGLLTQRFDVRRLAIKAMVGGAAALALFGQHLSSLALLSLVAGVGGFFANGATAGLYAVIARSFPAPLRAGGTGFVIGVGRAGAASGPILAGLLFSAGWPLASVALTLACGTLVGAAALSTLRYSEAVLA